MEPPVAPPSVLGLPQVTVPPANKFHVPSWAADDSNDLYAFHEINYRTDEEVGWVRFLPGIPYLVFGRDPAASHVYVGHPSVSNQHAAVTWDRETKRCYINDLESSSGTLVQGDVIACTERQELEPDFRIRLGSSATYYIFAKDPIHTAPLAVPLAVPPVLPVPPPSVPLPMHVAGPPPMSALEYTGGGGSGGRHYDRVPPSEYLGSGGGRYDVGPPQPPPREYDGGVVRPYDGPPEYDDAGGRRYEDRPQWRGQLPIQRRR